MNVIVVSSNDIVTILVSSKAIAMILIKTVINRVVVWTMFQQTLIDIITWSKGGIMIVASSNAMAIFMASSNAIAMILSMTVINGVVVRPMGVAPSMVYLIDIIMVGVVFRGGRMVVLTYISIMVM